MGMVDATRPFQLAESEAEKLSLGDFGEHPDQLLLHQLKSGDGPAKLDPGLGILEGRVVAGRGRAHGSPSDAVPRLIEAHEGRLQALLAPGEETRAGNATILEDELGSDRGTEREFPVDLTCAESRGPLLDQEAANPFLGPGPHHA